MGEYVRYVVDLKISRFATISSYSIHIAEDPPVHHFCANDDFINPRMYGPRAKARYADSDSCGWWLSNCSSTLIVICTYGACYGLL